MQSFQACAPKPQDTENYYTSASEDERRGPQYSHTFLEYTVSSGLHFSDQGFEVYDFDSDSYFEILFTYIENCVTQGEVIDLKLDDPELPVKRVRLNMESEEVASLNSASIMLAITSTEPVGNPAEFLQRKLSCLPPDIGASRKGSKDTLFMLGEDGLARNLTTVYWPDGENLPTPEKLSRCASEPTVARTISGARKDDPSRTSIRASPIMETESYHELSDAGSLSCKMNCDTESECDAESECGSPYAPMTPNMASMVNAPFSSGSPRRSNVNSDKSLRKTLLSRFASRQ